MSVRARALAGPLAVAAVFVALAALSWRRWPDLLMDHGIALEMARELARGKVLYRDLAHMQGALSPYLNAAFFEIFGASFETLFLANLTILAGMTALVFAQFRRECGAFAATVVTIVFVAVFGFGHIIGVGNYNFVSPYSHELVHGVGLGFALLALLARPARARHETALVALAGLVYGLIFLTKAECFVAATAGAGVALALRTARARAEAARKTVADTRARGELVAFALAALVPPAALYVFLRAQAPGEVALRGLFGTWAALWGSGAETNPFFRKLMGTDEPLRHLLEIARTTARVLLLVEAGALWARASTLAGAARVRALLLALVAGGAGIAVGGGAGPLVLVGQPLLLLGAAALVVLARLAVAARRDPEKLARLLPATAAVAYALALLAKMLLNAQVYHYGFALAAPGTLLLVAALVSGAPAFLERRGIPGGRFRAFALGLVALDVTVYVATSLSYYRAKDYPVGRGADTVYTYRPDADHPEGPIVARALERLDALLPEGGTFVALPHGAMLNFLAKRENPTGYFNLTPIEVALYGEPAIVAALAAKRPDAVVLVHVDSSGYGRGYFGQDPRFGRLVVSWVREHYEHFETLGAEPLRDGRFGIEILRRRGPK